MEQIMKFKYVATSEALMGDVENQNWKDNNHIPIQQQ